MENTIKTLNCICKAKELIRETKGVLKIYPNGNVRFIKTNGHFYVCAGCNIPRMW